MKNFAHFLLQKTREHVKVSQKNVQLCCRRSQHREGGSVPVKITTQWEAFQCSNYRSKFGSVILYAFFLNLTWLGRCFHEK